MRLNQFLKVALPKDNDLYTLVKGIEDFEVMVNRIDQLALAANTSEVLSTFNTLYAETSADATPIDRALNAFIAFDEATQSMQVNAEESGSSENADIEGINIFDRVQTPDYLKSFVVQERLSDQALLGRKKFESSLNYLFRLIALEDSEAATLCDDIISDMVRATTYSSNFVGDIPDKAIWINEMMQLAEEIKLLDE